MDDPSLQSPVLERSNVGMGMLVLNRPRGLDLATVNDLYVRLRNLEVNSLKRFVGLTAVEPGPFCIGIDPQELLLAATAARRHGRLPRFSRALLWHYQELAHLIADFKKPIVCQLSGPASDAGIALACLASLGGAHDESEVSVDSTFAGLAPMGGMSYVLARLRWHLGEFLALTGWPVRGADLVYAGLLPHWISPDALPFLELTSEKQLEVSELDARCLLDEHSLPLPDGFGDTDSLPQWILPLVQSAFSAPSVPMIAERLQEIVRTAAGRREKEFARQCLDRMSKASPLALHVTLNLIRKAGQMYNAAYQANRVTGMDQDTISSVLREVLKLELRAQQRLLCSADAVLGLHARCLGREVSDGIWSRRLADVVQEEVDDVVAKPPSLAAGEAADFAVAPRSEISLSTHPRLRRFHPDYDPATGLDHDPAWMEAESQRWSPDLFAEERQRTINELLGGADPSAFGQSRYVRGVARAA